MSSRIAQRERFSSGPLCRALTLTGLAVLGAACVSIPGTRQRLEPGIGAPSERLAEAVVPSNAKIDVDCDFGRVGGGILYAPSQTRVECPKKDVERYLESIGFLGGPYVDEPPEVELFLRFDPNRRPRLARCGAAAGGTAFNPSDVSFSTDEIGVLVELRIRDRERGDRSRTGSGSIAGVGCEVGRFMTDAQTRVLDQLSRRISLASRAALESAVLERPEIVATAPAGAAPRATPGAAAGADTARSDGLSPAPLSPGSVQSTLNRPLSTTGLATSPTAPAIPDAGSFGRYTALVIGIDRYAHLPDLANAVHDARSVGTLLRDEYGFDVVELVDPTRAEILQTLTGLRRRLEQPDNLLIYYAGHGWLDQEADEGYWLPADAEREDPTYWISNDTITAQLRALRAKHVMVVADSCYSGKLTRGIDVGVRPRDHYARMAQRRTRVVISSGGLEPVVDAGGGRGHSVFASAFLEALRENSGVIDGSAVFSRIRRPVMVNADQIPEYADIRKAGHDGGDFLFVRLR